MASSVTAYDPHHSGVYAEMIGFVFIINSPFNDVRLVFAMVLLLTTVRRRM